MDQYEVERAIEEAEHRAKRRAQEAIDYARTELGSEREIRGQLSDEVQIISESFDSLLSMVKELTARVAALEEQQQRKGGA